MLRGFFPLFYFKIYNIIKLSYIKEVDNRNESTIIEIMKHANTCGALACLKKGALSSLPTSEELKERYNDLYSNIKYLSFSYFML